MKKESLEKLVALLLVTLITLASCQKDDEKKDDEIREPVILLERLSSIRHHNNSLYAVFEYDKKNRLTKRLRYYIGYGEVLYDTRTIVYNHQGDLVKFKKEEINIITEFTKNGNIISFFRIIEMAHVEIELDTQGLPVKKTYFREGEISDSDIEKVYFTWENGNLIHVNYITYAEHESSVTYTYDDKKSPFYNCATPKWFLLYWLGHAYCSENNIETAKYSNYPEAISENTYNDEGFIASRKGWNSVLGEVYYYELK